MAKYDKTDLHVYCDDLRATADLIEANLNRNRPHKGSWDAINMKLNDACNAAWSVLWDLDGDQ
jgi:hypothetical protein